MEIHQIATSNPQEYKGKFTINELSLSDQRSSVLSIGELKFRIKYCTREILRFHISFLENKKWINTGQTERGIHTSLTINTDVHTRVIKILDGVKDVWYSLSEFDIIASNLGVTRKSFDDFTHQYTSTISLRNVNAVLSVALDENCIKRNQFASLHSDTSLTDFELRCEHGSVPVHRVVLAISSPVLKTFLESENNWLENRWYKFAKTDLSTLQHLKDYIYMGVLPDDGLENLLLLASCYMIEDLKNECISKILANVTPENALEICEFSMLNKMTKLFLGFLKIVQDGTVKVEQIANV